MVEKVLYSFDNTMMHIRKVAKSRLPFRRVDVEIHLIRIHLQKEKRNGKTSSRKVSGVRMFERLNEGILPDSSAVYE